MTSLDGGAVARFLELLTEAPARVLLLDYDGTLAPHREERDRAVPYPGVRRAMKQMLESGRTRVVVISGRTLASLRPLLGVEPPPELWGTHGWERLEPGGAAGVRDLSPATAEALREAIRALSGAAFQSRVEVKPASVAVHTRGLAGAEAERVLTAARGVWEQLTHEGGVEIHAFDGGVELRVSGWDKGDAVRALLAEEPVGTAVAYLGDDLTDEDGFAVLEELAAAGRNATLSTLVRAEPRPTEARAWLRPPEELLDFLTRWRDAEG